MCLSYKHSEDLMNKPMLKSKLNWIGALVTLLGIIAMPETQKFVAEFVPQEILAKIIAGAGLATIVIRSFFTEVKTDE